LLLITTNSEQIFPKMASPKCAISIFGSHHWILKHTLHHQFPSLEVWPCKSISGYLNEISTKHCHTTRFRKPLTRATQLINPEIMSSFLFRKFDPEKQLVDISMKSAPNNVIQPDLESHWPGLHNWLTLKLHNHFLLRTFDPKRKTWELSDSHSHCLCGYFHMTMGKWITIKGKVHVTNISSTRPDMAILWPDWWWLMTSLWWQSIMLWFEC
jgi:hypothetical protein